MSLTTLKTRCLIRTRYTGANVCCSRKHTAVIRHERGDTYRACTVHTRLAFDGLVDARGRVLPQLARNKLARSGEDPPDKNKWRTVDP